MVVEPLITALSEEAPVTLGEMCWGVGVVIPYSDKALGEEQKQDINEGLVLAHEDLRREIVVVICVKCPHPPVHCFGVASEE